MKDEIKIRTIEQQAIDTLKAIVNCEDKIIEIEAGKIKREYLVDNNGEINENNKIDKL